MNEKETNDRELLDTSCYHLLFNCSQDNLYLCDRTEVFDDVGIHSPTSELYFLKVGWVVYNISYCLCGCFVSLFVLVFWVISSLWMLLIRLPCVLRYV